MAVDRAWAKTEMLLAEARAMLEARGVPLVVVALPCAIQFGRPWTRGPFQERLRAVCARHQITFVDPLPRMEAASPARHFYYYGDLVHPKPIGNEAIASAIVDVMAGDRGVARSLTARCQASQAGSAP